MGPRLYWHAGSGVVAMLVKTELSPAGRRFWLECVSDPREHPGHPFEIQQASPVLQRCCPVQGRFPPFDCPRHGPAFYLEMPLGTRALVIDDRQLAEEWEKAE